MDERTLIAAARSGDREAFNELILRYQELAYGVAYRMLGDTDAAADATQEAFLAAYRGIGRFRGGAFKAWLLRIVTNACYDQLRAWHHHPEVSIEAAAGRDGDGWSASAPESPEAFVARQELSQMIQRALNALPDEQRVVIVLADIQGLSYLEIAAVLRVPVGTVKSRLNRARRRMRDLLLRRNALSYDSSTPRMDTARQRC